MLNFDLANWYYIGHPHNLFEISERCRHADHDLVPWLKTKGLIKRFWHDPMLMRIHETFMDNRPILDFGLKPRKHIHIKVLPEIIDIIAITPLSQFIGKTSGLTKHLSFEDYENYGLADNIFVTTADWARPLKFGYQLVDGLIDGFYLEV